MSHDASKPEKGSHIMHNIKDSSENYLETIYLLHKENGFVRSIDVANRLKVSRPSVSNGVKKLVEEGYLTVGDDGALNLTPSGEHLAIETYEKHMVIKGLLMKIGVDSETADEDACRMEHAISNESFEKLKEFLEK